MSKQYTEDEMKRWRAAQPQKMIVSKVIIKSDKGNVLLAKPNYKNSWQLPGGGVETGESPESATVREIEEELGLAIREDQLVLKGTIYKQDDEILFVVYELSIVILEDSKLSLQEDEITDYQFAEPSKVPSLISGYYFEFWKHYNL